MSNTVSWRDILAWIDKASTGTSDGHKLGFLTMQVMYALNDSAELKRWRAELRRIGKKRKATTKPDLVVTHLQRYIRGKIASQKWTPA